ncbi:GGDEF domain-containing protein [Marinobacterium stanieri]|uniref:GGDEF domain-containing protein n=1 Tax=Marinobacterium stanieri TaxID=49186 RepID=UPI000255845D|nr:GGDEF domain-containing protein [Marinobacterium stanieri]
MGLRARFIYLLLGLAAGFLLYVHWVVLPPVSDQTLQIARNAHQDRLELAAEAILPPLLESDLANVYTLLNAIKHDSPEWQQVVLVNAEGQRLYPLTQPETLADADEIIQLSAKVGFLDPAVGELQVVVDMSPVLDAVSSQQISLQIALLIVLALMLLAVWFQVEVVIRRPLAQMIQAAHKLMHGHFGTQLPDQAAGEIGELSQTFSDMRSAIERHHIDMQDELKNRQHEASLLKMEKQQAEFEAKHDPLTGIINRREFERRLAISLDEAQRSPGMKHVLMFIDLDHFKVVNDTCGHAAGDELLKAIAGVMRGRIREADELARFGGDEFAILLKDCGLSAGCKVAEGICEAVHGFQFSCGNREFRVGASIGAVPVSTHATGVKDLVCQADAACYRAKHLGRGQVSMIDGVQVPGK